MSEHEPRAYVNCHAYGCKMVGCMTRSTTGTTDWYCFIHFAAEPDDWQAITTELGRLDWLVKAAKDVRANQMNNDYRIWVPPINKELKLGQRRDLCWNESESFGAWAMRLEGVLQKSCLEVVNARPQAELQEVQS